MDTFYIVIVKGVKESHTIIIVDCHAVTRNDKKKTTELTKQLSHYHFIIPNSHSLKKNPEK